MFFLHNTGNTGDNAIEMSQAFLDIARFERFTVLNLFKYAFNVIQNWNTDALQCATFLLILVDTGLRELYLPLLGIHCTM